LSDFQIVRADDHFYLPQRHQDARKLPGGRYPCYYQAAYHSSIQGEKEIAGDASKIKIILRRCQLCPSIVHS
jgi:hypothetical protein